MLIAYSYPPLQDPQSIRWFHFSNILAEKGYKIDVVTVKLPASLMWAGEPINSNITIFRVFPGFFENFSNNIKSKIGTDKAGNVSKRKSIGFRVLKSGYWSIRKIMNNILIGDLRTEWLPFCLKFINKVDISEYSVLITSQEPFVDSLVGLRIKKSHPNILWIADMGDSILSPYYPRWRKGIDMHFEKKVVELADKVILTNNSILSSLSAEYGIKKDKFSIVTQGFDSRNYKETKNNNERFTMLFSGTLYEHFREPDNIIKAIKDLDIDVKLIIAGRNEGFVKVFEQAGRKVEFVGFVPYSRSLELQQKADVLINISNKQSYQVPGKFFEYLGSRKPILDIVYSKQDETAKLINSLNIGLVCKNSAADIKDAILKLYALWKNDKINNSFDFKNKNIYQYSWENGANKIENIIQTSDKKFG